MKSAWTEDADSSAGSPQDAQRIDTHIWKPFLGFCPCYNPARTIMNSIAMRKQLKIKRASRKRVPRAAVVHAHV